MAKHELPNEFDVIVIGTGLEESIVAAAASRNGHTVLHLDENVHYGDDWANFTLDGIETWIDQHKKPTDPKDIEHEENEEIIELLGPTKKARYEWKIAEPPEEPLEKNDDASVATVVPSKSEKRWTKPKIKQLSRKFNLDLTSRFLFAEGAMVELLISSNISRYAEFKSVSRVLTLKNGKLEQVPSSRADVFATKHVSVVEKRILMKFISFCVDFESRPKAYESFLGKTFLEFLKHEKLTENLINFVLDSIAMVDRNAGCLEGLKATQKFLTSIGRFGNTPFLFSMYGSGELPQAFCRLCAVFGGTYFLQKPVDAVIIEDDQVKGIMFNGQRITCKHLVADSRKFPEKFKTVESNHTINRKICLLEDSMAPTEKEQLTFVSLPPNDDYPSFTYVQEVGFGTGACPRGMYVLHMTTVNSEKELDESRVLPDLSNVLWSATFDFTVENATSSLPNLHFCSGPEFELDYDEAIANAKVIFQKMYGSEEFLPRAPDPEEIILGGACDNPDESDKK